MYRFLEDVTIADVAFEAEADSFEELLSECGKALTNVMITDIQQIALIKSVKFELKGENPEEILHNFLEELVFLKDTEQLLLRSFDISDNRVVAKGEQINPKKHELLAEVKAISWHKFKVEKKNKWYAFVIVDV